MATYQFTLYRFTSLGDAHSRSSAADPGIPGAGRSLVLAAEPGIAVTAEDRGEMPVVTAADANPMVWRGQVLHVAGRLTLRRQDAAETGAEVTVVALGHGSGGGPVGLASPERLVPGGTYRITGSHPAGHGDLAAYLASAAKPLARAQDVPAGFDRDCRIDTPGGPRQVAALVPGDLVTTLDNGSQPLRWVGVRVIAQAALAAEPGHQPVLFETGAVGNLRPLLVAPQHRLLLSDWRAQVYFGEDNVLIPAQAMVNGGTIRQVLPAGGLICHQLLFDRHEVILAEGALAESLHPGEIAADAVLLNEIEAQLPGLAQGRHRAAYPVVRAAEAKGLPPEA